MKVEMIPVQSSNAKAIGYDAENKELHVEYQRGSTYIYKNVKSADYEALKRADSIGKHLSQYIIHKHASFTTKIGNK